MNSRKLCLLLLTALVFVLPSAAQSRYILRTAPSASPGAVAGRHGLALLKQLDNHGGPDITLVAAPSWLPSFEFIGRLLYDPDVIEFERDTTVELPERSATVQQSTAGILDGAGLAVTDYFGTAALNGYVHQPATSLIRLSEAQATFGRTGAGVVAIIDTGIDPEHPILKNSLVPGYDFLNEVAGTASEYADVNPALTASLTQSTAGILDKTQVIILNGSTAAILDQSTAGILDTTQVPAGFGHGTMVAGIVHLTAPTALMMPLKAFRSDGTASLFDILRAVYYAADHHAKVINMSFSLTEPSPELRKAIRYATDRGVICVASSGNEGMPKLDYPATLPIVVSVASTSNTDVRSTFSNYGPDLFMAAPGENVITTYPGQNYAAVSGTSFSAPFVSGTTALLVQANPFTDLSTAELALSHAQKLDSTLGYGRLDVYQATQY